MYHSNENKIFNGGSVFGLKRSKMKRIGTVEYPEMQIRL
jgi:hypothetical protein